MHKISRPAKLQTKLANPLLGIANFTKEKLISIEDTDVSPNEEDILSPSIRDSKENFSFSNFGKIVKQTPFQTYSTTPSSVRSADLKRLSAAPLASGHDFLSPASAGLPRRLDSIEKRLASDSEFANTTVTSPLSGTLKIKHKSRFTTGDCGSMVQKQPSPYLIEVMYTNDS